MMDSWLSPSLVLRFAGAHVLQSTVFAIGIAALARLFRRKAADVRHRLWLAASIKFLMPFAALEAAGRWLAPARPPAIRREVTMVIETFSQPFAPAAPGPAAASSSAATPFAHLPELLVIVWLTGSVILLAVWCAQWRRAAAIVRAATPVKSGRERDILRRLERVRGASRPLPVLESDRASEPGVFGIMRPVLLWPRAIGERLDDGQVETILAHELAHVRRRDNLAAMLQMLVQAAFWFHPLVWWVGTRLFDERERACDESVLRLGGNPETYAESIIAACRWSLERPLPCVAGVSGSNLSDRIERIMTHRGASRLTAWNKALLGVLAAATVSAPIALGAATAPRVVSRITSARLSLSAQPTRAPQFEVASVKPNTSPIGKVSIQLLPGGRFEATNVTLRLLLRNAYQLQDAQITGGPSWMATDRFDVVAKAEQMDLTDPFEAEKRGVPGGAQLMLRSLLADRFKVVVHTDTRELPMYALVPARADGATGPELRRSTRSCEDHDGPRADAATRGGSPPCGMRVLPGVLQGSGVTLAQLARTLSTLVGRIVQDRTDLAGDYEFTLRWTPDQIPPGLDKKASAMGLPPIDANGASIFTAIREQLGLRLDSQKGPVDVLVVDRAERPAAN